MLSAVIPARNEEQTIARAVESLAAQREVEEVIVVNDQSTDATGEVLAGLAERIPKLRVVNAGPLPEEWTGKNYALSLGAAEAKGDWLLFTDADTFHCAGSAARAIADAAERHAAMVSYSPEQEMEKWWERALLPVVYCRLAVHFPYERVNDSKDEAAAANGQFIMILRDVYRAVGGHGAVAGEVLEDVALARRVKEAGYKIYFGAEKGVVETRMYRSFGAMWEGWTKNLYALMGGRRWAVIRELMVATPLPLIFAVPIYLWLIRGHGMLLASLAVADIAGLMVREAILLRRNLLPISLIQYYIAGVCIYGAALTAAWWKNWRGAVEWKGRTYPARTS